MELSDVIRKRRSVRRYSDRRPEPELVDKLIDMARRAPTAGYAQGIDFLVIDDPAALTEWWMLIEDPLLPTPEEDEATRPPMVIVVWSDPLRYIRRYSQDDKIEFGMEEIDNWPVHFWDVDAGMASMQLQLAAVDAGLSTWFFGIATGEDAVRERFGVPADRKQVGVIALGYRSDDEVRTGSFISRPRRPLDEQLHRNGW